MTNKFYDLQGYYNNTEATAEAFTEDGWFKTGDIFFREEDDTFHFVERLKLLLKYNSYQVRRESKVQRGLFEMVHKEEIREI